MGIGSTRIPTGVELNQDLGRMRDYKRPATRLGLLWSSGLSSIVFTIGLFWALQLAWPGSPLFAIIGFLARLLGTIIGVIVGLVVLLCSGSACVIKAACSLTGTGAWSDVLCPLVFALPVTFFVTKTLANTQLSEYAIARTYIGMGVFWIVLLLTGLVGCFIQWLAALGSLISK